MEYRTILGATDFSEHGDLALRRAAELAVAGDAALIALHVLPEPVTPSPLIAHYDVELSQEKIDAAKAEAVVALRERIPEAIRGRLEVEYAVRFGDPASEILEADARLHPDLIVLSTHGRRGWQRWIMGSVAERILQMAKADVLAVRRRPSDEK